MPTFHIKLLFLRVPESLPEVLEELHNDSRNLAASSEFRREKELLQPTLFTLLFGKSKGKSLDDRNCLKSMTHHAAGIGTCTQSGMTIPSHTPSEMHR